MDIFSALDMLIRSTELGSFAAAGRQLGLTSAAVGKQVGRLEQSLGVQLIVRSTRHIALTDAGRKLVEDARAGVHQVRAALDAANQREEGIAGTLRVSAAPAFGRQYVLPMMGPFLDAHPMLRLDWQFENRHVDLVAEGFDVGIAGGVDLAGGLAARALAPLHLVVVASPVYLSRAGLPVPTRPEELHGHQLIALRSPATGRVRPWNLHSPSGQYAYQPEPRILLNEPEAIKEAAVSGFGIALAGMAHVASELESGALVRLLPQWWVDGGNVSVYFPPSRLLPAKTRAFVDYLATVFREHRVAERLSAGPRRRRAS